MRNRGTQRLGTPGICGNTVAMVNAICDRGACFRNRWPTSEKLNATFFAAAAPPCKPSGERTRGILRGNDSRFPLRIELGVSLPISGAGEKRVLGVRSAMRSRRSVGSKALLILAFGCAISTSNAGQASYPPGRVVVKRVPQFGWNLAFNLQVDGRPVATIAKNQQYDGWLPAGRHVLTVYTATYEGLPQSTSTIV